ncbi:MAG: hypothetical protein ACR2M5_01035 [Nakamurella sp.]
MTRQELGRASPTSNLSTRQGTATSPDSMARPQHHNGNSGRRAVGEQSSERSAQRWSAVRPPRRPHVTVIIALARAVAGLEFRTTVGPRAGFVAVPGYRVYAGAFLTTPLDRQVRIGGQQAPG